MIRFDDDDDDSDDNDNVVYTIPMVFFFCFHT